MRKRRLMSDVVWVITVTRKLFDAWLSAVKWRDSGFNWLFALMSARCPLMRSLTVVSCLSYILYVACFACEKVNGIFCFAVVVAKNFVSFVGC